MNASELFKRYCEWHGLLGYSDQLIETLDSIREMKKGQNMFICGSWKRIIEGPMHACRTLVYRCDEADGHKGDHVDNVLLMNWPDPLSEIESKPRNELNWEPAIKLKRHDLTIKTDLDKQQRLFVYTSEGNKIEKVCLPGDLLEIVLSKYEMMRAQHVIDGRTRGVHTRGRAKVK